MDVSVDLSNVLLSVMVKGRGQLRHYMLMRDAVRALFPGAGVHFVCDAATRHKVDRKAEFEALIREEGIIQTPAREEADEYMIGFLRQEPESIIISRDQFAKYGLDDELQARVIPFTIIGQKAMISRKAERFAMRGIPIGRVEAFNPLITVIEPVHATDSPVAGSSL